MRGISRESRVIWMEGYHPRLLRGLGDFQEIFRSSIPGNNTSHISNLPRSSFCDSSFLGEIAPNFYSVALSLVLCAWVFSRNIGKYIAQILREYSSVSLPNTGKSESFVVFPCRKNCLACILRIWGGVRGRKYEPPLSNFVFLLARTYR